MRKGVKRIVECGLACCVLRFVKSSVVVGGEKKSNANTKVRRVR